MPRVFYGPWREQYNDYANSGNANLGRFPLGHKLVLPDNREYRFALNDGTAEVAASLYQSVVGVAAFTDMVADVARAIGATTVSGTSTGSTTAAVDIFAEGIVHTNDDVGEGYSYRIRRAMTAGAAHASVASASVFTVNMEPGESLQVATTTATSFTLTRNRFHQILIHASPPTSGIVGVSPGVAAANRFYWSQVKGYAAVLASGTLLRGLPVMASITTDGAVENMKRRLQIATTGSVLTAGTTYRAEIVDQDGSATGLFAAVSISTTTVFDASGGIANNSPSVGLCIQSNVTTEQALIDLQLAGGEET